MSATTNEVYIARLTDRLCETSPEEICTYGSLEESTGLPLQSMRFLIPRAILAAGKRGACFRNIRLVGYKRLASREAFSRGVTIRKRYRRAVRKERIIITCVTAKANDLTPEELLRNNREAYHLGLIETFSRSYRKIEDDVPLAPDPGSISKTSLELMKDAFRNRKSKRGS